MSKLVGTIKLEKDLKKFNRKFASAVVPASKRALLRVSRTGLGRAVRGIAKNRQVKAKIVRGRSGNRPLKPMGRVLTINAAPVPLGIMGPKGRLPKQTKNGVRVAGRHYPHAFVAKAFLGQRYEGKSVFERVGRSRLPIREIRIPIEDVTAVIFPKAVRRTVEQRYDKEFDNAFNFEVKRQIKKRNKATLKLVLG